MLDYSHLPSRYGASDIQLFNALGQGDWQQWRKPRGKSTAFITCLSSGAGGGGGTSGPAGLSRAGGGGGGSGAISRLLIPLVFLPDILFCNVAVGGLGGVAGAAGSAGGLSLVCVRPEALLNANRVCAGCGTAATGGSTVVVGSGATASGGVLLQGLGVFTATAGLNGGAAPTWGTGLLPLSGGANGGGTTNADVPGGSIAGSGWFPTITGGTPGSNRGQDGYVSTTPFGASGGGGGGASNTGPGGAGGNGEIGCGGGGGGAGTAGGVGGRGGHGQIMIVCW